jgi:hypothetical protein
MFPRTHFGRKVQYCLAVQVWWELYILWTKEELVCCRDCKVINTPPTQRGSERTVLTGTTPTFCIKGWDSQSSETLQASLP